MQNSQSLRMTAGTPANPGLIGARREFIPGTSETFKNTDIRRMLSAAILAGLAARLLVAVLLYPRFLNPTYNHINFAGEFGEVAYSIVTGRGFSNPYWVVTGPTAMYPPVFPYLLSGIFAIFGIFTKASALVLLALNSLFSALTCLPVFYIARKDFGLAAAKLAVWGWAFFPYAVYFSANSIHYASLSALLLSAIVLAALHLQSSNRTWAWAGFGFLFGFAALTNPVVLAFLPLLGAWLCYCLVRQGRPWVCPAATGALVLILALAPWLIRNYRVFHRPVFLKDNFWMEVYDENLTEAPDWWNMNIHPGDVPAEMAEFQRLGELGFMAEKRRQALAIIESNPALYVERCVRRVVNFWTGFWTLRREYLRNVPLYLANILLITLVTLLSFVGLYRLSRNAPKRAAPYFFVLLSFPGVYYLTHSDARYRHPIEPLLVVLACSAISPWLSSRRRTAAGELSVHVRRDTVGGRAQTELSSDIRQALTVNQRSCSASRKS